MATFRFPTTFSGNNTFVSNKGGGITLHNTRLQASGTLLFEKNEAVFGGAIAMDDRCIVSYGVACKTGILCSIISKVAWLKDILLEFILNSLWDFQYTCLLLARFADYSVASCSISI